MAAKTASHFSDGPAFARALSDASYGGQARPTRPTGHVIAPGPTQRAARYERARPNGPRNRAGPT